MLPGWKLDVVTMFGTRQLLVIAISEEQLAIGSNRTKTHILLLSNWPIFTNKLPRKLKKRLASKVNQSVNHRTCSHGNSSVKQNQIKLSFCERYIITCCSHLSKTFPRCGAMMLSCSRLLSLWKMDSCVCFYITNLT